MTTIILSHTEKQTNKGRRMLACHDRWRRSNGLESYYFLNSFTAEQKTFVTNNTSTTTHTAIARELRITVFVLQKLINEMNTYNELLKRTPQVNE